MKKQKRLVAAVLLVSMLLTMLVGGYMSAGAVQIVTTDSELAYEPLAENASIAYEQHESGYTISLDRAADSVTMDVTAVPRSGRGADGARLYIRTGVELKANTNYQVSFALSSEKELKDYTISFDGGTTKAAYGRLDGHRVEAGGTDRVSYQITPRKASGELIIRLSLGKTDVNKFTFYDLSVGEAAPGAAASKSEVLVDKLDYSAPGAVSYWTNTGFRAGVTSTSNSTTLTMLERPAKGGEVWEVQLKMGTGFTPKPGKAYRISATLSSSAVAQYEVCYNNGSIEKGYDVLYGQWLEGKGQTLTRMLTVPGDMENPGELILQFSLGNLKVGDKVTVSNIRVVEGTPNYRNALPNGFAFDKTWNDTGKEESVSGGKPLTTNINWTGEAYAVAKGSNVDPLTYSQNRDSVTLKVNPASKADDNKPWEARFHIATGESLSAGTMYRVSFKVQSSITYIPGGADDNQIEFQYGTGLTDNYIDNKAEHAKTWHAVETANTPTTITDVITAKESGNLWITLYVGKTNGKGSSVTVSDIKIEEVEYGSVISTSNLASVTYPTANTNSNIKPGSFSVRTEGSYGGSIFGDGSSATIICTGGDAGDGSAWKRGMFTGKIATLTNTNYTVSFDIKADEEISYDVCYNKDDDWSGEKGFGVQYGKKATSEWSTNTFEIPSEKIAAGDLKLRIDLGRAGEGVGVTVRNIQVKGSDGKNIASVDYPTGGRPTSNPGSFSVRDNKGSVTGDGNSASMTVPNEGDPWQKAMLANNICGLAAGKGYEVSFNLQTNKDANYGAYYFGGDEKANESVALAGNDMFWVTTSGETVTQRFVTNGNGNLSLRVDLKHINNTDTTVTVSDIVVKEVAINTVAGTQRTVDSFGSIWTDFGEGYAGAAIRSEKEAEFAVWKANAGVTPEGWKAKMWVNTGIPYVAGKGYRFSFDITSPEAQREFGAGYNGATAVDSGTWAHTLAAGETKTIVSHGLQESGGNVTFVVELGKFNGMSNNATISNIQVEEVDLVISTVQKVAGLVNFDCQPGYGGVVERQKDSATLNLTASPSSGMEAWKAKLFIDTEIRTNADEGYQISFDVLAEKDADFEVCYNQGDVEKGLGALYNLHAEAGKVQTITATCGTSKTNDDPNNNSLRLQLNLGMVQGPNKITISNLKVERGRYNFSSTNSAKGDYRAPSAVSYWAHEDYTAKFTSTDSAITANVEPPAGGAEAWKVKLFLDTGVLPKPGKYYKVTANVVSKMSQSYDICYNNGGVENGFGNMGGLQLSGGKQQVVEKLVSIPADIKNPGNLTLQFNLGKTSVANAITVSGVKVEEVTLSYTEMMANFLYNGKGTSIWTYNDYTATIDQTADKAVAHITSVPSDAAVWKVKLFVNTGVLLQPGKTYQVSADMLAAKGQSYEVCYNNEEVEKGYDALYGQYIEANKKVTVSRSISVPESMTDAGELVLQFAIGGDVTNDVTVSNVSVQELNYGASSGSTSAPDTVINLNDAAGTLDITREKLTYKMKKISADARSNEIAVKGANLRADDLYTVNFTAKANKELTGTLALTNGKATAISEQFQLTSEAAEYSFTTQERLSEGGFYDILWQFGSADNQKLTSADVEISNISVYAPGETLEITRSNQKVTVNGKAVKPDIYNINGSNYFKLRDLAMLMNNTDGQFVVRYNAKNNSISLTTGKAYVPVGGELTIGADRSASCVRSPQNVTVDGKAVNLKAYNIGGSNFFRLRDLSDLIGFKVDYAAQTNTVLITSPLTPEAQEKNHAYDLYFLPELDGEAQAYVGDTMPYYEDGTYYIYYLKDGGDSYNHSVYVASTKDFIHYTDHDNVVLSASREDVQDNWIGTGSVVKIDKTYYFFYTGFNASGSQEYHEKIMVAKSSSPTGTFEKVKGWEIVPPASLGQKNDFRDPQAYYDPATQTISLTITASQEGKARILKYTLSKDLQSKKYDGIIFTDPTGAFWNLECSDTFQIGDKWYLTYSGQDDTLWYATADSRFGPYTNATRMEGKLFYAAKHVENGKDSYMVGWARRANSASSTQEVSGWAGNFAVQKLQQKADGSLILVPVDGIVSAFNKQKTLSVAEASLAAGSNRSYKAVSTSDESFMLKGEFTYSGTGSFGLDFDFNGQEDEYKLISLNPANNKISLALQGGAAPITEMQTALRAGQKYSFTYIQDGSVGIFYVDGQTALTVRLYGVTDKPIYLFAENNNVTFTSLRQYTR